MSNVMLAIGKMPHLLVFILMPLLLFSQQGQTPQRDLQITKISASPPVLHSGGDAPCSTITVTVSRTPATTNPTVTLDLGVFRYDGSPGLILSIVPVSGISMVIAGVSQDYRFQVCAPPDAPPGSAVLRAHIYSRPKDWNVKPPAERTPFTLPNNRTFTTADYVLLEVQE